MFNNILWSAGLNPYMPPAVHLFPTSPSGNGFRQTQCLGMRPPLCSFACTHRCCRCFPSPAARIQPTPLPDVTMFLLTMRPCGYESELLPGKQCFCWQKESAAIPNNDHLTTRTSVFVPWGYIGFKYPPPRPLALSILLIIWWQAASIGKSNRTNLKPHWVWFVTGRK